MILVVEDDQALLKLIQRRLGDNGFHTDGVTSGASALRWLQEHSTRLMLLDYSLPDMMGEELLRQLEAKGLRVPFVVATGHGSETVAVEMMKRGARDYLIKGASFLKLLPTVVGQTLTQLDQERRLAEAEEELRRAHDELERRVQQRTAELAEANAKLRAEMEERRRAEERASQHQAELAHFARLSTVGEMVAELAHELNQPLAAISSYAQACARLLRSSREDSTEDLVASVRQVVEQAERAAEIIRRLRRFVKKGKPSRTALDLSVLVREIAAIVEVEARTVRVDLRFDLLEPCPPVMADRIQIEQVLINLIRNGLEAMRESQGGRRILTIETRVADGQHLEVAVHDQGVGIPPDMMKRVFERYFTTKPHGIGMGLPISRSIVESHGGRLGVTSDPQSGTTFRFHLPIFSEDRPSGP
ncbi:MAG: response regulator [Pirellulales bacterium]|nr:response regulator [Pirellulales bacterium]